MTTQMNIKAEIPLNKIGRFRKIRNPVILDDILAKMQDDYVLCEFLNRVVGGTTYSLLPKEAAQARYDEPHLRHDPSNELMAIYTKDDVIKQRVRAATDSHKT